MEQPIPDRNRRYTVEAYLALDGTSDVKYEYWDGLLVPHGGWETDANGRIIGMAGGTAAHSDVAVNLIGELRARLKGTPCKVGDSDLRVRSPRWGRYHYPDVSVTWGPRQFDPPDGDVTLVNPQVLIEVLSPSNRSRNTSWSRRIGRWCRLSTATLTAGEPSARGPTGKKWPPVVFSTRFRSNSRSSEETETR